MGQYSSSDNISSSNCLEGDFPALGPKITTRTVKNRITCTKPITIPGDNDCINLHPRPQRQKKALQIL